MHFLIAYIMRAINVRPEYWMSVIRQSILIFGIIRYFFLVLNVISDLTTLQFLFLYFS